MTYQEKLARVKKIKPLIEQLQKLTGKKVAFGEAIQPAKEVKPEVKKETPAVKKEAVAPKVASKNPKAVVKHNTSLHEDETEAHEEKSEKEEKKVGESLEESLLRLLRSK